MELLPINERFTNWGNGGGIFSKMFELNETFRPEWLNNIEHAKSLDRLYHGARSYNRIESSLSYTMFTMFEKEAYYYITEDIIRKFSQNWEKLYATLSFEYNPIWNVDGTEERTIVRSSSENKNETSNTNKGTNVVSDNTNNSTYGFNSSSPVPSSKVEHTGEQNETEDNTITANNTGNENVTETFKRGGNIGVTTTQKMINEEREVNLWNFYDEIFKNVDSVITSAYWG